MYSSQLWTFVNDPLKNVFGHLPVCYLSKPNDVKGLLVVYINVHILMSLLRPNFRVGVSYFAPGSETLGQDFQLLQGRTLVNFRVGLFILKGRSFVTTLGQVFGFWASRVKVYIGICRLVSYSNVMRPIVPCSVPYSAHSNVLISHSHRRPQKCNWPFASPFLNEKWSW